MSDKWIGYRYSNSKGAEYTVVSFTRTVCKQGVTRKRYTHYYNVECPTCKQDPELFGDGIFEIPLESIKKGKVSCGCGSNPSWTEYQNRIRVSRECDKSGYVFSGWFGDYCKSNTYLNLYNPASGNKWNTTSLYNFLSGFGDPTVKNKVRVPTVPKVDLTNDPHLGREFPNRRGGKLTIQECIYTKRGNGTNLRSYILDCSSCSLDEELFPYGSITSRLSDLKSGQVPCGCGGKLFMKPFQGDIKIKRVCKDEGLKFLGWDTESGGYERVSSVLKWECKNGHQCSTKFDKFFRCGDRCRQCRDDLQIFNGYMPERAGEKDYLYLLFIDGKYLKVGRSTVMDSRLKFLRSKRQANTKDIKILKLWTGTHQEVYDIEQELLSEFRSRGFSENVGWTGEALKLEYKDIILNYLAEIPLKVVQV
ncbi:hypothetical protein NVP1193O_223 [Vibrio phage 1.193.O._10N.286.52.C6]|nr:hypothetical protein NVP1193O_223 [Vibrio phage 1.193.O._10N.286.52.C6]